MNLNDYRKKTAEINHSHKREALQGKMVTDTTGIVTPKSTGNANIHRTKGPPHQMTS